MAVKLFSFKALGESTLEKFEVLIFINLLTGFFWERKILRSEMEQIDLSSDIFFLSILYQLLFHSFPILIEFL